jgi:hypothetical protein
LNCLISGDIVEHSFLQPIRLGVRVKGDRDEHPFSIQIQFRSFAATVAPWGVFDYAVQHAFRVEYAYRR